MNQYILQHPYLTFVLALVIIDALMRMFYALTHREDCLDCLKRLKEDDF